MKVFITGASGFIGGSVAVRLLAAGHSVRGLVRDAEKAERIAKLGVEPVIGTLDDRDLLVAEAQKSDGVINAADSDHRPGVLALIEGLWGSGKPLLHTSGSSVISDDARGNSVSETVFEEETPFVVPPSKQARRDIDTRVLDAIGSGIRAVVICPSNVYGVGHGLNPRSVQIPFLVDQAKKSGVVKIVGRGVNVWSNVHIDDLAELYLLALEKAPAGTLYFVENGEVSFGEIGAAIAKRMKLGPVVFWPAEEAAKEWGEVWAYFTYGSNSRVNAKRARKELGWKPLRNSAISWIEEEMPL
ncbi:NAD-dependent epimerase/dehydratase family protein [Variovorax sp. EL159]|uniref:NAD-dependent epimerase/dehydratase family protein n=1 Tax=Variovorax sp. EL159 TaxID=1566270 RepID=UPI00087E926C|nr:NAD-dependent epimerase/dehydratase family protein [Variovorax sp. EL159]SCX72586.1 Nucleoside-diphosphate-sugar epimerase [Variovorax sp. EL159]